MAQLIDVSITRSHTEHLDRPFPVDNLIASLTVQTMGWRPEAQEFLPHWKNTNSFASKNSYTSLDSFVICQSIFPRL